MNRSLYERRSLFTAKQPDKPCELVLAEPSSACKQLRLTTYNCKNIRIYSPIFTQLQKSTDIILIQEHWLFKCQLNLLNELNECYIASGKSVDQYDPIPPIQPLVDMEASQYFGKKI